MFAVIDTETTGLSTRTDRIVEVAVIGLNDWGQKEWEWSTMIDPQRAMGATGIHGITLSDMSRATTFERYAGHITRLLGGRILVGHNIEFDLDFLRAEFGRIGITAPHFATLCTARLAKKAGFRPFTLAACCRRCGIPHADAHTARGDALSTAQLLRHLVDFDERLKDGSFARDSSTSGTWPYIPLDATLGAVRS